MSIRLLQVDGKQLHAKPRAARKARKPQISGLVPAAARTPTTFSDEELDLAGAAIESFVTAVGGRAKLVAALAVADSDSASDKVVNCLLDPAFATWSLRRLCAYAGLTVADLFASYKKALFVQAHVDAAHRITSQLPPIVDDVMRRALPQPQECPRCFGEPTTPGTSPCPQCKGEGTILSEPDLDRQKVALELGRLIERKAGVVMQQNVNASTNTAVALTGPGSLEQLQQAVGDLLFAPTRRRSQSPVLEHPQTEPPDAQPRPPLADPDDDAVSDDADEDEEADDAEGLRT